jgi:hypothetical protein
LGNLVAKLPSPSSADDERVLKILLLLKDVAEGLKALHEAGVVHGDLVRVQWVWLLVMPFFQLKSKSIDKAI